MIDILQLAADLVERNQPCALCTVVRTSGSVPRHPGSKMVVGADGAVLGGTVGGGDMENRVIALARQAIDDGKARLTTYQLANPAEGDPGVCGGEVSVFVEPLLATLTLVIIGAGHVGRALTHLAKWSGFRVILVDDRADLCSPQAAPGADQYLVGKAHEVISQVTLTPQTYVAMVTRGYPIDVDLLPHLLQSPVANIGVIGSKRRWLTASAALRERGVTDAALARVHAPIGIEISAETPEEISISIMAVIIALRRSTPPS